MMQIGLTAICHDCKSSFVLTVKEIEPTALSLWEALEGIGLWPCPTCKAQHPLAWPEVTDEIVKEFAREMDT